jgi:2-methylcitrate dehydratase PrpD
MTILESWALALARPAPAQDERLSRHLIDGIGAWIAGSASAEGRETAASMEGKPALLGDGPLDRLALAVATTRLTEFDDIHRASCITCGAVAIPASLIMARAFGADAKQFEQALRNGYETMMRLGMAVNGPAVLARGVWPTYLAAPMGAAAVASALLGLPPLQTAQAMAIALAQTSGAPGGHGVGRSSRWLLSGLAARAGVTSALMASRGFIGDLTLLDADWFQRTHGLAFDPTPFTAHEPMLNEISMKPWCAAKQTISATDAFRLYLAEGASAERIVSVHAHVPNAYRAMISSKPPGRLGRIVNLGWQLGLVAYNPQAMMDIDRDPAFQDVQVEAFAQKVEITADSSLDAFYPTQWRARLEITLDDGSVIERTSKEALGDPGAQLDAAALAAKFLRATRHMGADKAQALLTLLQNPVETIDLAGLSDALPV